MGAGDENQDDVSVYPNPFLQNMTIVANGAFVYAIYDLTGKLVDTGTGIDDVLVGEKWNSGIYLVKVQNQKGSKCVKAAKK